MNSVLVRMSLILVVLFATGTAAFPQNGAAAQAGDTNAQVIYTGKLMGYFRFPSRQRSTIYRCPALYPLGTGDDGLSPAAFKFLEAREQRKSAILVGTGDNFAPQWEARVFDPAPQPTPGQYPWRNKELFFGDGDRWVPFDQVLPGSDLEKRLESGRGMIPIDNVGCFLAAARYAAVVPGKHDFYFGAERVRHLARFMAGIDTREGYQPVQMLGANLVIKAVPLNSPSVLPSQIKKPWFKTEWPTDFSILNLSDGGSVYPWFSYVQLKLRDVTTKPLLGKLENFLQSQNGSVAGQDLKTFVEAERHRAGSSKPAAQDAAEQVEYVKEIDELLKALSGPLSPHYVCLSDGNPNEIREPVPQNPQCSQLKNAELRLVGKTLAYYLPLDPVKIGKEGHFSTLFTGQNYGLCRVDGENTYCRKFSVHTPFFYSPHKAPLTREQSGDGYTDPDPYVLLKDQNAVIFGVVDTLLRQQVGLLNFSWPNTDPKLTTGISVEDPAEALRQQLDYFERRYEEVNKKPFTGLKVLLAQMSPLRARVLSARFPNFQVIVTEADSEQGTSETNFSTIWKPKTRAGAFLAVPLPYFDRATAEGTVRFSWVEASQAGTSWQLSSNFLSLPSIKAEKESANNFWSEVRLKLKNCLPDRFSSDAAPPIEKLEQLKWLTLCAMREQTQADVALIQKRDLFDQISAVNVDAPDQAQQILDRLIWKGDLLTLLYLPGSAIKQALTKSDEFKSEESSTLSLQGERQRTLEKLGIDFNPDTKEYLINEAPIEDKKVYAVATTDYIGAGDTGYPDLAAAALNPRTHPAGFPKRLNTISGIVCRKLYPTQAGRYCQGPLDREAYLDKSTVAAVKTLPQPGLPKRFWDKFPFKPPAKSKPVTSIPGALEQRVQYRPIWAWSLKNFSVGFNWLDNNFSDKEIGENFAGVSAPGVTATKTHSLTVGVDTRFSRTDHLNEYFIAGGIDFKNESKGDAPSVTNLINNRVTGDLGWIRNLKGGRSQTRLGLVLSLHAESQLEKPYTNFDVGTTEELKITRDRGLTLLFRPGLRWQNRLNYVEAGAQGGWEFNAVRGYRFDTQGTIMECLPNPAETFAKCIKTLGGPPNSITKDSATAIQASRPRAGGYLKFDFTIPFHEKVNYQLTQEGDWFLDLHDDNATDTKYWSLWKHRLKFPIFSNLSIGPTWNWLLYKNKKEGKRLFQNQFGLEASFAFNLFNRREPGVQFKNKP